MLDERSFREQTGQDSGWSNLLELYRRLEWDEVAGARVRARFRGQRVETLTDRGDIFHSRLCRRRRWRAAGRQWNLSYPTAWPKTACRSGRLRK